jgi:acetolactate synthase-1/3 small subunit
MTAALKSESAEGARGSILVSIVVNEALIPLDRVLGGIRRRNLPLVALSVGPGPAPGTSRVFAQLMADAGDVDRLVRQLRKLVGVQEATVRAAQSLAVRQLVLIRLAVPGGRRLALLQTLSGFEGSVVAESATAILVQVAGPAAGIERCLRLLAPFGILDVARSSPVALDGETAAAEAPLSPTRQDDRS